jgi:hypothetical protein
MNKIYDKLLLALAVLVLLAGVGFYVVKSGTIPSAQLTVALQPADHAYLAIPVPATSDVSASWPDPEVQSTGWTYDVFTPPKIFIGENGEFRAEGWVPPPPPPPFGVYLVEVKRDLYRLQIEGYLEDDPNDSSKSLVLFFDEGSQRSVRARVGQVKAESGFELIDFNIERIRKSESEIYKEAKATIMDMRSGEQVLLTQGEPLYDTGISVVLASRQDPSFNLELNEAGQAFKTSLGEYVLKEINLEQSTVTVEKKGNEERESETQLLSSGAPTTTINPRAESVTTEAEETQESFDFVF